VARNRLRSRRRGLRVCGGQCGGPPSRGPADPLRPRLWSPELVMGAAVVVGILMLAHMLSLGTGRPFQGGGF